MCSWSGLTGLLSEQSISIKIHKWTLRFSRKKREGHKLNRNLLIPRVGWQLRQQLVHLGSCDALFFTAMYSFLDLFTTVFFLIHEAFLLFYATTTCCPILTTQKLFSPFPERTNMTARPSWNIFKGV